ncbi:adhesin [Shigella sonnei]|nr:adhesin [Shigella sonnei]SVG45298.1 adhesin [Shigella sonnei]SVG88311.1 adhesin [Shigella sonnei]
MSNSPFLNSIRTDMRQKGYALKTEKTYLHWIKRFILFHKKRHPQTMGSEEVRLFLSSLANSRHVAINTQKIALNALAFLYNRFLQQPLGDIDYIPAGFAPIFPDICYHLTHYKPAAADIPVASDNPAHYADAIRYNARTPLQGSLLPLTRLVWA